MAEIHVRIEKDGLRLWRTIRSASGSRVRDRGAAIKIAGKEELTPLLPVFDAARAREVESGESNDYIT